MAKSLDEEVAAFRSRPLDAGPYPYLWLDALAVRVREGGRIVRFRLRRGHGRERRGLPRDPRAWTSSRARMRPPGGSFWPASWNVASQVFSWWSLTTTVGFGKAIDALLPGLGGSAAERTACATC